MFFLNIKDLLTSLIYQFKIIFDEKLLSSKVVAENVELVCILLLFIQ